MLSPPPLLQGVTAGVRPGVHVHPVLWTWLQPQQTALSSISHHTLGQVVEFLGRKRKCVPNSFGHWFLHSPSLE